MLRPTALVLAISCLILPAAPTLGATPSNSPAPAKPTALSYDPAGAEVLFEEGRAALELGDFETACQKFAASQRLDPGAGTLMNWATCEEKLGRIASAWQHFREALDTLPPGDDREEYARTRAAELEKRLPTLVLRLSAPSPAGTVVLRDGVVLDAASLGTPLPVDPGVRAITVKAPGHADARYQLTIAEQEQKELAVRAGKKLPAQEHRSDSPVLGWSLVGAGAAGLGAGIATSFLIEREQDLVEAHCDGKQCDDAGLEAADRGQTLLWVNAASYGVGALALGTGLVLVLSHDGDEPRKERPRIGGGFVPGGAVVGYGGRF